MTPQEALEIRNNPTYQDVDNVELSKVCPSCNNANLANPFVRNRVYDYCPNCGQALDWGD